MPQKNVSLAQLVEHLTLNQQVRSSSLRWDTIFLSMIYIVVNVSLAQLVEHLTLNQQVRSSSLRWDTIFFL